MLSSSILKNILKSNNLIRMYSFCKNFDSLFILVEFPWFCCNRNMILLHYINCRPKVKKSLLDNKTLRRIFPFWINYFIWLIDSKLYLINKLHFRFKRPIFNDRECVEIQKVLLSFNIPNISFRVQILIKW